jgi:hypothetical protein
MIRRGRIECEGLEEGEENRHADVVYMGGREGGPCVRTAVHCERILERCVQQRVARELLLEARAGLGCPSAAASSVPSVQFPTLR